MNFEEVKELIGMIDQSELKSFELVMDNVSVKMSKNDGSLTIPAPPVQAAQVMQVPQNHAPEKEMPVKEKKTPAVQKESNVVKSPIVGTFYQSAGPGKALLAKEGDHVKKGDILCIIEAMKIMNEITSPYDGTVLEVLVQNESLVEYGQPLFRIG